ncbi:MAG: hypothetical protein EBT36_07925 [Betaproteobacteria bacterium]|nr:hypothetical protein [Betaproteobacteria bacterium]NBO95536.1 hypothetical protein [Betaproteobacteria bacterium]NBP39612.1 hypothetical protein [Betaproteobacteria bacterium]NBQ78320.1 hypothetical protein [Betaproteobacteria bacterium]NBQ94842.1 hypothetical protein [Betaproteobacteria bacterium]
MTALPADFAMIKRHALALLIRLKGKTSAYSSPVSFACSMGWFMARTVGGLVGNRSSRSHPWYREPCIIHRAIAKKQVYAHVVLIMGQVYR